MADEPRNPRIGHHARREHRIGRRQQRTEQERLGPGQVGERVGDDRHQHARDRHGHHELAERQPPGLLEHLRLDLEPVAEQDDDQRDRGQVLDEARLGGEVEHLEPAVTEHEAGDDEQRRHREERAMHEARAHGADDQQRSEDQRRRVERGHSPAAYAAVRCATPPPSRSGSTARVPPTPRRWTAPPRPTWRSSAAASPACGPPCWRSASARTARWSCWRPRPPAGARAAATAASSTRP